MLAPLLPTKVSLPKSRPVPVLKQSSEGLGMDICSAWYPPRRGYGKSTTIRMWIEDAGYPVAWVTLEKPIMISNNFLPKCIPHLNPNKAS